MKSKKAKKKYIINQKTMDYDHIQLMNDGWEPDRVNDYAKEFALQDLDGGAYKVQISLRAYENLVLVFINDVWIGRALYYTDISGLVEHLSKYILK